MKNTLGPIFRTDGLEALAASLSREEFVTRFNHPFLYRPRGGVLPKLRFAPVHRSDTSANTDFVSVGRADDCDIVIQDQWVSKLHAMLWIPADEKSWTICDARSVHGTHLNGERIPAMDRLPIRPGDLLHFGRVGVRFLDTGQVYDLLTGRVADCTP